MKYAALLSSLFVALAMPAFAQTPTKANVPYVENGHERQALDVYAPPGAKGLPVLFWIHGGGWQAGNKAGVKAKPQWFMDQGFVFVSTGYRLLPEVDMGTLIRDVAKSVGWTHQHIAELGGDPSRITIAGHSAGAQLAAILCTDDRYLKAEGVPFASLKGCVPVDGDTFNIPAIIEVAETRARTHGLPLPSYGHRLKFGNDPALHRDFSAVTHVAKGKHIPPFLILYVSGHPDTTAQAQNLSSVLKQADVPVTLFGGKNTNHVKLNDDLGLPKDEATEALKKFIAR